MDIVLALQIASPHAVDQGVVRDVLVSRPGRQERLVQRVVESIGLLGVDRLAPSYHVCPVECQLVAGFLILVECGVEGE